MNKELLLFVAFMCLLLSVVLAIIFGGQKGIAAEEQACRNKGGIAIRTNRGSTVVCLSPGSVIK